VFPSREKAFITAKKVLTSAPLHWAASMGFFLHCRNGTGSGSDYKPRTYERTKNGGPIGWNRRL